MTRQHALDMAHEAPRCQHYRLGGRPCGSPALTGRRLCYFHHQALRPKLPNYKLPLLEDATSVQFGLVQVARAIEDKAYDSKTGALLLYALQTASSNLKRLQQEQAQEREQERREQAEEKPGESLAEILTRGLGLRPPDPARDYAPAQHDWPPPMTAKELEDEWGPEEALAIRAIQSRLATNRSPRTLGTEPGGADGVEGGAEPRQAFPAPSAAPFSEDSFDAADQNLPPARRGPASAPPRNEAGRRGRGSA